MAENHGLPVATKTQRGSKLSSDFMSGNVNLKKEYPDKVADFKYLKYCCTEDIRLILL